MRKSFYGRYAVAILVVVFFFVPFALRGARMALERMQNDVKDWLPASFPETAEMDWFWRHFIGERFVVVSWQGCTADDSSYQLLLKKLQPELPPSRRAAAPAAVGPSSAAAADVAPSGAAPASAAPASAVAEGPDVKAAGLAIGLERPYDFVGDRLQLFSTGNDYRDWGGRSEKWLRGEGNQWYFLTPDGNLYRWSGSESPSLAVLSRFWRSLFGGQVQGERVAAFSGEDAAWYYERPQRLEAQLFRNVTTGPAALAAMTGEQGVLADAPAEARRRLNGLLFGPDGEQTCLVLTLTRPALGDLHRVLGRGLLGRPRGRLLDLADQCGISVEQLRLGGPPVDNVAIDEEGTVTLVRLVLMSVVLGLCLAYACLRSVTATMIVFLVGGISAVLSMAGVGWLGAGVDAVMMSMPSLVYVLGISGSVHLINYYREAVDRGGVEGATGTAVAHAWRPALFCSTTTAFGLASLCTSDIVPIAKFGFFSALAVMGTLILLFTYLPAALEVWPQATRRPVVRESQVKAWYASRIDRLWLWLGGGIVRHHWLVATTCVLVIAGVGYGVTRINTSVNLLKLFDKDAKILADYAWLEQNLGKLVPMEVVVRYAPDVIAPPVAGNNAAASSPPTLAPSSAHQLSFLERMEIVGHVQRVIDVEFGEQGRNVAGASVSAATFAPPLPSPQGNTLTFARRSATNARLEEFRNEFLRSEYLRLDDEDQSELWRISVRIGALQDVDYGKFVGELQRAVEPVLAAQRTREQVVEAITRKRGAAGCAGASVCLLAVPKTAFAPPAENAPQPPAEEGAAAIPPATAVDAERIYCEVLRDLLNASRLRVEWHIPEVDGMPENLASIVASYDAAIVVGDGKEYDQTLLSNSASLLLRADQFHAAAPSPAPAHGAGAPRISAVYTGLVPIVYKAQRTLLNSLVQSTNWSFVSITPLMMLVCRSCAGGLVAMLPNVLPVFIIFGAMGWMGVQVDVGSMMTASIALGVAVDDTIHYLSWFRMELGRTNDRRQAILAAYRHCATPTFQAAIISGLGLSVFAFSTFTPTQRFGYLMLAILFAGVVAELVFFPALLAGPLGRVFRPTGTPPEPEPTESPVAELAGEPAVVPHGLRRPDHVALP
jgi:uncharacterized protein